MTVTYNNLFIIIIQTGLKKIENKTYTSVADLIFLSVINYHN